MATETSTARSASGGVTRVMRGVGAGFLSSERLALRLIARTSIASVARRTPLSFSREGFIESRFGCFSSDNEIVENQFDFPGRDRRGSVLALRVVTMRPP